MKIALFGYGKMGREIEQIALQRNHEVVLKIDIDNRENLSHAELQKADAAIEFTNPDSAKNNILFSLDAGVPLVIGTTGWYTGFDEVKERCQQKNGTLLYGTNFSVGVNIFFAVNKKLASIMNEFPEYSVAVEEIHHTQKKDAPSGTATTIAEQVSELLERKSNWKTLSVNSDEKLPENYFPVYYDRVDNVPGFHKVRYASDIDKIELSHEAFNRKGFALGAVLAAEFLKDKKGIFTTEDLFSF